MVDYTIKINNGSFEQNFELRSDEHNFQWELYLNGMKSYYTIKCIMDTDDVYYDLCKKDEPIKAFEFENGGLGVYSNLLEVLTYIMKIS
jgi:hypothetical protein